MPIPEDIVEAIAISNAKAIGEQPAILANLALANQINNNNLAQQNALANQQALFQLQMATIAKCVDIISAIDPSKAGALKQLESYKDILGMVLKYVNNSGQQAETINPSPSKPKKRRARPKQSPRS